MPASVSKTEWACKGPQWACKETAMRYKETENTPVYTRGPEWACKLPDSAGAYRVDCKAKAMGNKTDSVSRAPCKPEWRDCGKPQWEWRGCDKRPNGAWVRASRNWATALSGSARNYKGLMDDTERHEPT